MLMYVIKYNLIIYNMVCDFPISKDEKKILAGAEIVHDNAPGRSSDKEGTYPKSWKIIFDSLQKTQFFDKLDIEDITNQDHVTNFLKRISNNEVTSQSNSEQQTVAFFSKKYPSIVGTSKENAFHILGVNTNDRGFYTTLNCRLNGTDIKVPKVSTESENLDFNTIVISYKTILDVMVACCKKRLKDTSGRRDMSYYVTQINNNDIYHARKLFMTMTIRL